jgi:hypothetical protein
MIYWDIRIETGTRTKIRIIFQYLVVTLGTCVELDGRYELDILILNNCMAQFLIQIKIMIS